MLFQEDLREGRREGSELVSFVPFKESRRAALVAI